MDPNATPSPYDNPALQSARTAYEGASKTATTAEVAGYSLPDQLRSALNAKFSKDNPMVQDRESALTNYLNTTTSAPLSVTPTSAGGTSPVILNPLQQADLIQRKKSSALSGLTTANDLLGLATGGVNNIVDSASRAYQGQVAQKQGAAKIAGDSYTSLLNELSARADQAFQEKQFNENVRQFDVSQANKGGTATQDKTAEVWQNLVNNSSNEYDIWKAINANQTAWKAAGVDVNQLWKNHSALVTATGKGEGVPDSMRTQKGVNSLSTAQKDKNKVSVDQINTGMAAIQRARESLANSGSGMQNIGYGLRENLPFGGIDSKTKSTNANFADVNTQLFRIAGTQFPKNEQALLGGIVLGIDKSKEGNTASLTAAAQRLNDQLATMKGLQATDINALRKAGYNEDDIYEYLRKN
jgi:hypothetical protein